VLRRRFSDVEAESVAEGWEEAWREFHRGVVLGGFWVGPPWEEATAGVVPIVIDPGRAFGTGAHATTRMCIELLQHVRPASILDVGCGSGVLAIAAAKLGFAPVTAVDIEEEAVETARANAAANDVEIVAQRMDALADPLPSSAVVVANVALAPVELLLARIDDARLVITSGYLDRDEPSAPRWKRLERRDREGWAADLFVRA